MLQRDPPGLDALRGFEAAARHLSFTKAAEELHLTQSAISRQVKALEDRLGVALFERRRRELRLTEEGRTLYKAAAEALGLLRAASAKLRKLRGTRRRLLTVTTTVSFASMWLVPRLADFRRRYPQVDVRIAADNRVQDLEREGIELAIRHCSPKTAGANAIRLFGEQVFPVCAKSVVGESELKTPQELSRYVLLHLDEARRHWPWLTWEAWFERVGAEGVEPRGALWFSHYDQLIQAAVEGQGIALGRSPLVDRWLEQGRLVRPFGRRFASAREDSYAYFLLFASGAAQRPEVMQFAHWLEEQARAVGAAVAAKPAAAAGTRA